MFARQKVRLLANERWTKYIVVRREVLSGNGRQGLRYWKLCLGKTKEFVVIIDSYNSLIEIVNRVQVRNACFYSFRKLLTYRLLSTISQEYIGQWYYRKLSALFYSPTIVIYKILQPNPGGCSANPPSMFFYVSEIQHSFWNNLHS